ncbi:hypothetical protein [Bradyrhizobium lupini]|uniref:hypothetical protein n=1 Tax=Rhizobium lupini TaxID=136996 RepID=UPI0034C6A1E7
MALLSQRQKFKLIVRHFERTRSSSDGDAILNPEAAARARCGFCRTTGYYVKKGLHEVKDPEKLEHFENTFREIVAEPGSRSYQAQFDGMRAIVDRGGSDPQFLRFVVPAAYGHWAQVALDVDRHDAARLLAGRLAEVPLYYYCKLLLDSKHQRDPANPVQVDPRAAHERGIKVMEAVAGILAANLKAPPGLFEHGSATAQEQGYRMLRIRLLSDYTGWQGSLTKDDAVRAEVYAKAYRSGRAEELMWLHEELAETSDVAHSNGAFNLATHAGDWRRAAEYGVALLKAFPALLTEKVDGLAPLLNDRTVGPGIAAMITHRELDIPPKLRRELDEPRPKHKSVMGRIRLMIDGVKADAPYLTVLKIGEGK